MKKYFEEPSVKKLSVVTEIITDDFTDTDGGAATGFAPEN